MPKYEEPLYLISVVANILNIHPQTLRQYEREGLIEPDRTQGKMRLYSQKDLDRIRMILNLTRDMGVNLAGVDVIFKLQDKIKEFEEKMLTLESKIKELESDRKNTNKSLVKRRDKFNIVFYDESEYK